jgi:hypothetical protein
MNETRERQNESFDSYGDFKQHDKVSGTFNLLPFEGEVKSFTRYLDSGDVLANIATDKGDVHVPISSLKLQFRPGQVESPKFKAGKLE